MNKKCIFGIGALMSVLACSVAFAVAPNKVVEARAYSKSDGYTATNDHYIASFHDNSALTSHTSESEFTFAGDNTSTINWKVSYGKYSTGVTFYSLKMGKKAITIKNSADQTFKDLYDTLAADAGFGETTHYVSALYSTTAISNVQGVSVSWGNNSTSGKLYIYYKTTEENSVWTKIYRNYNDGKYHYSVLDDAYDGSNETGTWNYGKASPKTEIMYNSGVLGKNAQIAILFDRGTDSTKDAHVYLNTLMVNRVESIISVMNYMDSDDCGSTACEALVVDKNKYRVMLDMSRSTMEQIHVDGGVYQGVTISGLNIASDFNGRAKEPTYYGQFVYVALQDLM